MRFFSRIVFICNCCFIAAVILRWVEIVSKKKGNGNGAIQLQPLESTIVVLGYGAIVVNFFFNIIVLLLLVQKKQPQVAQWQLWFNFLCLLAQVYYFFLA